MKILGNKVRHRAKVLCRGTIRLSRSLIVISKIPDAKYSLGEYGSWSVVPWVSRQMGKWLEQTTRATVPPPVMTDSTETPGITREDRAKYRQNVLIFNAIKLVSFPSPPPPHPL